MAAALGIDSGPALRSGDVAERVLLRALARRTDELRIELEDRQAQAIAGHVRRELYELIGGE